MPWLGFPDALVQLASFLSAGANVLGSVQGGWGLAPRIPIYSPSKSCLAAPLFLTSSVAPAPSCRLHQHALRQPAVAHQARRGGSLPASSASSASGTCLQRFNSACSVSVQWPAGLDCVETLACRLTNYPSGAQHVLQSQQRTAAAQTPAQGRNRPHTAAPQTPAHGGGQLGSASPQAAARTPARSLSRQESRRLCIICCDEQREAAFVPCGHRLSCMGCAGELRSRGECPVCRSEVSS